MTAEEALKALKLKDIIIEGKASRICEFFEGFEIAKKALEKQIPKKPVEKFPFHHCPSCNEVVFEHKKYCSECGQKLDWSGEE